MCVWLHMCVCRSVCVCACLWFAGEVKVIYTPINARNARINIATARYLQLSYSYPTLTLCVSLPLVPPSTFLHLSAYLPLLHCRLFANILWQISLARNLVLHSQQAQLLLLSYFPLWLLATLNYITPGKHMAQIIRQIDKSLPPSICKLDRHKKQLRILLLLVCLPCCCLSSFYGLYVAWQSAINCLTYCTL